MRSGLCALLLLGGVASAAVSDRAAPVLAVNATDPPIRYTVRRGDNLYTLALRYMMHLGDYHVVQELNHVRDPYRVPIGTVLLVPRPLLKSDPLEARILAFRGAATIDGRQAELGATLGEGSRVRTGAGAFLTMGLADGSTVTLPSQSAIAIERLRRFRLTNELERLFRLEDGRSQTQVTPRTNGRDRFEMRTPLSVAAVRGTYFRVAVLDGGRAATAEVLGGHVGLAGGGADTVLDPGLGSKVTPTGTTGPVRLLPPPELIDAGVPQAGFALAFSIRQDPAALRYRAQVARDARFLDIVEEAVASGPEIDLAAVPNGDWFLRLTAIDGNEIEGLPRVTAFERRLGAIHATVEQLPGAGVYRFSWQDAGDGARHYRLTVMRADQPDMPVIDEPAIVAQNFVVTGLPRGDYRWHVQMSAIGDGRSYTSWSAMQTLHVGMAETSGRRAQPPAP